MKHTRFHIPLLGLFLLVAGCGDLIGEAGWRCDVTLTMDNRTASGSGTGSSQQEALDAALATACGQLGLTGNALSLCEAGQNPGAFSWSSNWDCETT